MKYLIVLVLAIVSIQSHADRGFAIRANAKANATLMSSPPLPSLSPKGKGSQTQIKLAYFQAKTNPNDTEGGSPLQSNIDFSGYGVSAMVSNSGSGVIGYFGLLSANKLSGEFASNFGGNNVTAKNAESTLLQAGSGLSFSFFRKSMVAIQFFIGPSINKSDLSQDITSGSGDDFTMTMSPMIPSYFIGAQMEIRAFKFLTLNPYFIMSNYLSGSDSCQKFDSNVRSFGSLWDLGDPNCQNGEDSSTKQVEYDTNYSALGINLIFPTISITINIYAESQDFQDFQSAPQDLYAIGFTF
jgi:hypothetical protein